MIVARTPFRVRFVGGGTDLDASSIVRDGQVVSTTIDTAQSFVRLAADEREGFVAAPFAAHGGGGASRRGGDQSPSNRRLRGIRAISSTF